MYIVQAHPDKLSFMYVHLPLNLCWTWHSINDARDKGILKVNVPEQSSQSRDVSAGATGATLHLNFQLP